MQQHQYDNLVSKVDKEISMLHQLIGASIYPRAVTHEKTGMLVILSELTPAIEEVISLFSERKFDEAILSLKRIDALLTDGFDLARFMNDWDDEDAFVDARAIMIEILETVPDLCQNKTHAISQLCI